jgi:hypothetical protein
MARTVLAEAFASAGRDERAHLEWAAAATAFEAFGATGWTERTRERLAAASHAMPAPSPPTARRAVFRCDGETRLVRFEGITVHLRDLKGLRYIQRLLAEPGREFHVLDLVAVERGTRPVARHDEGAAIGPGDSAIPALDDQARAAYQRRLAEVDDDIEEARRMNDLGRLELAEHDREYLIAELTRAAGLGGRHRMVGGTAERARTAVTRSVRYAVQRLGEHEPVVAAHLSHAIRTGTYCSYVPDPRVPVVWET